MCGCEHMVTGPSVTRLHVLEERNGTNKHIVRLIKFIEGDIMFDVKMTPQLITEGATYLGKFQKALEVCRFYDLTFPLLQHAKSLIKIGYLCQPEKTIPYD